MKIGDYARNKFQKGSLYVVVMDQVSVPGDDIGPGVVLRDLRDQKLYAITAHTLGYYYEAVDKEDAPIELLSMLP